MWAQILVILVKKRIHRVVNSITLRIVPKRGKWNDTYSASSYIFLLEYRCSTCKEHKVFLYEVMKHRFDAEE